MRAFRLFTLLLCCLSGQVFAQTLEGRLYGSSQARFEPDIRLEGLEHEGLDFGFRLAAGVSGPVELGASVSGAEAFGPLGNVSYRGQLDLSTGGGFSLSAAGAGVIGSVALDAELSLFSVDPGEFRLEDAFAEMPRPFLEPASVSGGLQLGGSYRLSRNRIAEGGARFYLTPAGVSAGLGGGLRLVRLVDRDEGTALLQLHADPGFSGGYGAAGFRYDLRRRSLPSASAALWLGAGSAGVWPGLSASASQRLRELGGRYEVELSLEPFRTDAPVFRGRLEYVQAVDKGELLLGLFAALGEALPAFSVSLGYGHSF